MNLDRCHSGNLDVVFAQISAVADGHSDMISMCKATSDRGIELDENILFTNVLDICIDLVKCGFQLSNLFQNRLFITVLNLQEIANHKVCGWSSHWTTPSVQNARLGSSVEALAFRTRTHRSSTDKTSLEHEIVLLLEFHIIGIRRPPESILSKLHT